MPEVWFLEGGRLELFRLAGDQYERIARSTFLPELDLDVLASFVDREDQTEAVLAYRDAVR